MIELKKDGRVARIVMSNPERRNALDARSWADLATAIAAVRDDPAIRALIVESDVEKTFCAGSSLHDLADMVDDETLRAPFRATMRGALDPLHDLPIPTIAAVDGDCFGAGIAIALACDIRIAGDKARFCIPPARLGVAYPAEDVGRLVALIGRGQAGLMLYGAGVFDADDAIRMGLAEQRAHFALDHARELAAHIAGHAPQSISLLKHMVSGQMPDAEANAGFDELMGGDALREGLAAFREKRKPEFR